jgi:hypothetical protein
VIFLAVVGVVTLVWCVVLALGPRHGRWALLEAHRGGSSAGEYPSDDDEVVVRRYWLRYSAEQEASWQALHERGPAYYSTARYRVWAAEHVV